MSGSSNLQEQLVNHPLMNIVFDLVKNTAAVMLASRVTGALIELSRFQILITTEFRFSTEGMRGIKFDVVIEIATGERIVLELVVPREKELFGETSTPVACLQ